MTGGRRILGVAFGALVVALVVAIAGGCSGSSTSPAPAPPNGEETDLPPAGFLELSAIFEPEVAPLGLRVTRASLVDAKTRRYSTTGTHLALYVEPTGAWSEGRYVETIIPLTRTLAPTLFGRWAGVESFDVCQEPPPGVDDRGEPTPVTTVDMTRSASAAIDWETVDLRTFVGASQRGLGLALTVSEAIAAQPAYQAAVAANMPGTGG